MRDLVWVMAAPNLLDKVDWLVSDEECMRLLNHVMPELLALDSQPEKLNTWIAERNPTRLGRYFEVLLGYWLTHLIDTTWFSANQIVKSGRIVTGEYDLLWRDAEGQLNHWEAAVKLYMQVDDSAGLAGYIGTMTRDRLDIKADQLRDKQLQLSKTTAGAAALPEPGEPVLAKALLKGWLFYPAHAVRHPAEGLSPAHLTGWWQRWAAGNFNLPMNLHWRVLNRLSWLSPLTAPDTVALYAEADFMNWMATHFAAEGEPLLVAGLSQNTKGSLLEVTRGFIVPLTWGEHISI